jgi:AraC-like DNA-binding protein
VLEADSFVVLHDDRPVVWTASAACRWAAITVPLDQASTAAVQRLSAHPHGAAHRRTPKDLLEELRRLMDRALSIEAATDIPTGQHATERELGRALSHALEYSLPANPGRIKGRPQFSRSKVIADVLTLMDANEGEPLFIADLCRAAQVSERALRNIFQEYFGIGPIRLLKLRRLHEIRAALLMTSPQADTVTRIAARFGLFDLSLLACNYKRLFGELPSQTLSRPAAFPDRVRVGWLRYASRVFLDASPPSM